MPWRTRRRRQPITSAAATPSTGSINGATSMAPMTTAVESARRPCTAMAVDSVMSAANRNEKLRIVEPSGKRVFTMRS